jgi:hypothetical protein
MSIFIKSLYLKFLRSSSLLTVCLTGKNIDESSLNLNLTLYFSSNKQSFYVFVYLLTNAHNNLSKINQFASP